MGLSVCLDDLEKRKIYCPVTTLTTLPKFIYFKKRNQLHKPEIESNHNSSKYRFWPTQYKDKIHP